MADYVLEVNSVKYRVSTRLAPKREYHMTATVADKGDKTTSIDNLSIDEQEALFAMIKVLNFDPPNT